MVRYIISFLLITLLCSTLAYADEEEFDISIKRVTGGKATFIDKDNNEVTFEFYEPREEDYITIEDNNKYLSGLNYGPYIIRGKMQENDYYKFLKAGKVTADDAKIIVASPPVISNALFNGYFSSMFDKNSIEKSKQIGTIFKKAAKSQECTFVDLNDYIVVSEKDGLHYEPEAHKEIAVVFFQILENLTIYS